ncbi:hypothetical protein EJ08DRAFT_527244 [Tothia fuscella]|uniref:Uncharacterized protein n=1 Tax=Tothia fuscella TaxID=1048955 RepID=A0A9P4NGI8_9PEZI|nr:hypothetical protein EJ08DRAFT_527244 [Tothia fuscella]
MSRYATESDVLVAGTTEVEIEAWGSIDIEINRPTSKRIVTLLDVIYAPGFLANIIYADRILTAGLDINLRLKEVVYKDTNLLFYRIKKKGGHWIVGTKVVIP